MIAFDEIKPAAKRVFHSRDGELVLEYLLSRFYHCRLKDEHLERQVGRRDVLLHIRDLLTEGNHEK